jgi:PAS domain S-box-containing protein
MNVVEILIADDNELFRRTVRSFIESRPSYRVCGEAGDGIEAIEKIRQLHPDVVLMDINMPRMGGLEATRIIRRQVPECKVLIITQNHATIAREQARAVDATGSLAKSDITRDLIPTISRLFTDAGPEMHKLATEDASPTGRWVHHGGALGKLVHDFDWARTPLGAMKNWPQSLQNIVRVMLASRFAMWMSWGPELTFLYNDAYAKMTLGKKHPWALGKPSHAVWEEIWGDISPRIQKVLDTGEATWDEGLLLFLERSGYREETYHTFSYSPLLDDGGKVTGHLCVVTEETDRIIGERRVGTLRSLAAELSQTITEEDLVKSISLILEDNQQDLPFTLTYLLSNDGKQARLCCRTGLPAGHPAAPEIIELGENNPIWPIDVLLRGKDSMLVEDLPQRFPSVPTGAWDISPTRALLLPIAGQAQGTPAGVLVTALNPYRPLDVGYAGFLSLIAGQLAASVANSHAYSEQKKRAEALAEIDRAKTMFFSNVSHEFRTPLTLMLAPLEDMLAESQQLPPHQHERLDVAHRNALRLLKLVNTLLDFSRIEAGRLQASYEPLDLAQLTSELASVFRSAIERAGLQFIIDCPSPGEPVYVDRELWEKIVFNLLSNAFKFTFEGEIEVSIRRGHAGVELAVRDTGIGIPAEDLPHLFDRFYRGNNIQGRTFEGSGIGLALVQDLAKLHAGAVRVESQVGQGSTFIVTIPLGKDHLPADRIGAPRTASSTALGREAYVEEALHWLPSLEPALTSATAPWPSELPDFPAVEERPRILLADDNVDMREYLRTLLSPVCEVQAVPDGEAALNAIRERPPDLILADVMMPKLDGFGLLKRLRADVLTAAIPMILLSARAGEESRVEGLGAGADDYLTKPFSARELMARVKSQLNMARLRREGVERERKLRDEAEFERNRIRELFTQAPAGIALFAGPEHRWEFANSECLRITGRTQIADLIGKTVRETFPALEAQDFVQRLDEVYRTAVPYLGYESKVTLNRGRGGTPEEAYFNIACQPLRGMAGKVEQIMLIAIDVTEQVLAKQRLHEGEQRFREMIDALPAAIYTTDAQGRLTHFNTAAVKFSGRTPELGTDQWCVSWKLFYPDGTPMLHEDCPMAIALKEGRIMQGVEVIAERPDGTRRCFTPFPTLLRDSRGTIVGGINMLLDTSERKEAERTTSLLAAIVDSSDDAIVSKNLDGIITSWNRSAERMFGYTAQEAIGKHVMLIIPRERRSEEDDIISRLRRGERVDHFETVRRHKDGTLLDVALTISPIRDSAGRVIGASKTARDITQRRALERVQKVLIQLAGNLNHAQSSEEIYAAALEGICGAVGCGRASILLFDDTGVMRFVSWRGLSENYRKAVEGHSPWKPDERNAQPRCISDIETADLEDSLKRTVSMEGIRALSFIPLLVNQKLIGKFMTYFAEPHNFTMTELELSMTIARQLGFAIQRKRSEEALRKSEEQFRQLSETLEAEVRSRTRELEERNADVLWQSDQLRELSWRLLRSQDEERRHIARELHDSAGQTLTVLGMDLARVIQKAERNAPNIAAEIEPIQERVQQLHREIRTASYLLHPPLLDENGLYSAITWYVQGLLDRSGLDIHLDIPQEFGRLPRDMELVIFRLVQECLTNIHRHSESKTASIRMARESTQISLDIRDQGKGMSPPRLEEVRAGRSGVGIRGMRERLRQFGGIMNIESSDSGTRILVTIPVPKATLQSEVVPLQVAI